MPTRFLALFLLTAATAAAQDVDSSFGPFVPFGLLEAKLDSRVLDDTETFVSDRAGAYLVVSSGLDHPLLLDTRNRKVDRVDAAKIRRNADLTVSLLTGAVVATVGPFEVADNQLKIPLGDDRLLTMGPNPPLLGPHEAADLKEHDPSYAYRARLYPPSDGTLAALRQETRDVTVRVYFGSWCATCSRIVPWLLQVDQALAGSHIRFEYYGLPPTMDDPVQREAKIDGVPTVVVSVGEKELGRRSAPELGVPEKALLEILGGG